jgi:hypothetical protein
MMGLPALGIQEVVYVAVPALDAGLIDHNTIDARPVSPGLRALHVVGQRPP